MLLLAQKLWAADELPTELISAPGEAINVFDFHTVAKAVLPPAHYGYLATGTDANETLGRSTIESLPEVVAAVNGRIPVLIDSGFRRGTDVFKALALGADAVCVGRPYIWGLASFGQPGVEAALGILGSEFERVMKMAGVTSIGQINSAYVEDAWG
jgi:isopentenyl diphosphate isomerase/L-lactate dehydrogenase-like FMN-dependent dehydrogenase